jgi:hypothetical protein
MSTLLFNGFLFMGLFVYRSSQEKDMSSQAWYHTLVIQGFWRLRQEDCKFKVSWAT